MSNRIRLIVVLVVLVLLVGSTAPWWWDKVFPSPQPTPTLNGPPSVPPASTFDGTSTDEWMVVGGTLTNPGSGGKEGGENNGFLSTDNSITDGGTSYYVAPSTFHGNWSAYATLQLDLFSSGGAYYTSGYEILGDIVVVNGPLTAVLFLPERPPNNWKTFVILLINDADQWKLEGGATSLAEVLQNVTDFRIRAEYGVGADTSGLDNVALMK